MKIALALVLTLAGMQAGAQLKSTVTILPDTPKLFSVSNEAFGGIMTCDATGEWGDMDYRLTSCLLSEGATLDEAMTVMAKTLASQKRLYCPAHKPLHAPQRHKAHRPARKAGK